MTKEFTVAEFGRLLERAGVQELTLQTKGTLVRLCVRHAGLPIVLDGPPSTVLLTLVVRLLGLRPPPRGDKHAPSPV
jgi:hypothetical protein